VQQSIRKLDNEWQITMKTGDERPKKRPQPPVRHETINRHRNHPIAGSKEKNAKQNKNNAIDRS